MGKITDAAFLGASSAQKSNSKTKKTKKEENNGLGTAIALGASQTVPVLTLPVSLAAGNKVAKMQKNLSKDSVEILNTAGEKVLNEVTNLGKKGVKINHIEGIKNKTNLPDKIAVLIDPLFSASEGKNAFFTSGGMGSITKNSVAVNKNKFSATQFHELGHAFNWNNSSFWKGMQKLRTPGMLLASGIAIFAACTKNAEPKDGEELTKGQKAKNFIRKNSGPLAFLAMVPMLAEEGMASIRGGKWAKEMLPKNLAAHVSKTNKTAYLSYAAAAAGVALSAFAATKIKDHFVEKNKAAEDLKLEPSKEK